MAEELNMQQAQNVYETICRTLDAREWKYDRHDEDLVITFGVQGDDLPMDVVVRVRPKQEVVNVYSSLPFKVPEEQRELGAMMVCAANYGTINGCFDMDLTDGEIRYRMATSYRESLLGDELFNYMIGVSLSTVDRYNDKFLMVLKGMLSLEQFMEWDKNN